MNIIIRIFWEAWVGPNDIFCKQGTYASKNEFPSAFLQCRKQAIKLGNEKFRVKLIVSRFVNCAGNLLPFILKVFWVWFVS